MVVGPALSTSALNPSLECWIPVCYPWGSSGIPQMPYADRPTRYPRTHWSELIEAAGAARLSSTLRLLMQSCCETYRGNDSHLLMIGKSPAHSGPHSWSGWGLDAQRGHCSSRMSQKRRGRLIFAADVLECGCLRLEGIGSGAVGG